MPVELKKKGVKLCYVTSYICILAIGMIQFGKHPAARGYLWFVFRLHDRGIQLA